MAKVHFKLQRKEVLIFVAALLFWSCRAKTEKEKSSLDSLGKTDSTKLENTTARNKEPTDDRGTYSDTLKGFEKRIYFDIDKIYTGKTYVNKNNVDAFYRVLEIPEEENVMLIAENIAIGEEGGKAKLIKLVRLTDDNSALPKFGLSTVDSLRFLDSVRIQGYFNSKKMIINLDDLKEYHPAY
jgi:hypothetical protein